MTRKGEFLYEESVNQSFGGRTGVFIFFYCCCLPKG